MDNPTLQLPARCMSNAEVMPRKLARRAPPFSDSSSEKLSLLTAQGSLSKSQFKVAFFELPFEHDLLRLELKSLVFQTEFILQTLAGRGSIIRLHYQAPLALSFLVITIVMLVQILLL